MRLEQLSLAGHPYTMLVFSFHTYCTSFRVCILRLLTCVLALNIWQLNNRSTFNVWCNLAGFLTKLEVVTVELAVKMKL